MLTISFIDKKKGSDLWPSSSLNSASITISSDNLFLKIGYKSISTEDIQSVVMINDWINNSHAKTIQILTENTEIKISGEASNQSDFLENLSMKLKGISMMNTSKKMSSELAKVKESDSNLISKDRISGSGSIQSAVATDYKKVPIFTPSKADIPEGYKSTNNDIDDIKFALKNPEISFRSFFNDLPIIENEAWIEKTLFTPAFNETLYCKMVLEYHRFSINDLRSKKDELTKNAEKKGAGIGGLIGIMAGGIMAPFMALMGANAARMASNNLDPRKPIEDYLPDPSMLFLRDEGTFTNLKNIYSTPNTKRRICMRKCKGRNENIYWDLFPMILFSNWASPAQVFKWQGMHYMRPISAGLYLNDTSSLTDSLGYDPLKYRRSNSYDPTRAGLSQCKSVMSTKIIGPHIEKEPIIFSASLRDDKSFDHYYFDYSTDGQIF